MSTGRAWLLTAASQAGVRHLLFISIVGVDRVPWGYFRRKLAAEQVVRDGGAPWSVLRATQFHSFLDGALRAASRLPALIGDAGIVAQPVDPRDVADAIVARVAAGAGMSTEEFGGPEVLHFDQAVAQWLDARRLRRPMLRIRLPGKFGRAVRSGYLTTTARPAGQITWREYLAETAGRAPTGSTARKRALVIWFERHVQNPPVRAALRPACRCRCSPCWKPGAASPAWPGRTRLSTDWWRSVLDSRRARAERAVRTQPRGRSAGSGQGRKPVAHGYRPDPRRRCPGPRAVDE